MAVDITNMLTTMLVLLCICKLFPFKQYPQFDHFVVQSLHRYKLLPVKPSPFPYEAQFEQAMQYLKNMDEKYGPYYNTLQLARSKIDLITNLYEALPIII